MQFHCQQSSSGYFNVGCVSWKPTYKFNILAKTSPSHSNEHLNSVFIDKRLSDGQHGHAVLVGILNRRKMASFLRSLYI